MLTDLPEAINDPILVAKMHGQGNYDIVTRIDHPSGKILVAVGYTQTREDAVYINSIRTVFGKRIQSIAYWLMNDPQRIAYLNKKRSLDPFSYSSGTNTRPTQKMIKAIDKINEQAGLSSPKLAEANDTRMSDSFICSSTNEIPQSSGNAICGQATIYPAMPGALLSGIGKSEIDFKASETNSLTTFARSSGSKLISESSTLQ